MYGNGNTYGNGNASLTGMYIITMSKVLARHEHEHERHPREKVWLPKILRSSGVAAATTGPAWDRKLFQFEPSLEDGASSDSDARGRRGSRCGLLLYCGRGSIPMLRLRLDGGQGEGG